MKIKIALYTTILFLLLSCARNELHDFNPVSSEKTEGTTVFMTTEQVFTSVEMREKFDPVKHPHFASSAVEQLLAKRMDGITPIDPVYPPVIDSEEIPIWTFNQIIDTIYTNGQMVYESTFEIIDDDEVNPILDVIEASVNPNHVPARMTYINGDISIYNASDILIHQYKHIEPNLKQYADSLNHYWLLYEEYIVSQNGAVPGQASSSPVSEKIIQEFGYQQVGVLSSGDLILEKEYDTAGNMPVKGMQFSHNRLKSTIICSPDLTKIRQESLSCGDQLLSRTTTTYVLDHTDFKTYLPNSELDAPIKVVSQSLIVESGIPKVYTKIDGYSKNITRVHNYINSESYEK